jgi:hypothetical protein
MGDRSGLRVVVRTRLSALEPAWDNLVERLPLPSPFLRSWWLEHTAGGAQRFLLVMDGACWSAVSPCKRSGGLVSHASA